MIEPPSPMALRSLGADHDPVEIDGDHAIEVAEIVVHQPAERAGDAGVVHHRIQRPEALLRVVDRRLHARGIGDVGVEERHGVAELADEVVLRGSIDVGDQDPSPLLHEDLDDRTPDPFAPPVTIATFPSSSSLISPLVPPARRRPACCSGRRGASGSPDRGRRAHPAMLLVSNENVNRRRRGRADQHETRDP